MGLLPLFFFHVGLGSSSIGCEELAKRNVTSIEEHYKHSFKNASII
jgi:hypothetical protein